MSNISTHLLSHSTYESFCYTLRRFVLAHELLSVLRVNTLLPMNVPAAADCEGCLRGGGNGTLGAVAGRPLRSPEFGCSVGTTMGVSERAVAGERGWRLSSWPDMQGYM